MPELAIGALDSAPADPREWAAPAGAPPELGAPVDPAVPPAPVPPSITRESVSGAVRTVHWGLWHALRSDELVPIAEQDLSDVVDGLHALAERHPRLAQALRTLSLTDPAKGLPKLADVERRMHEELLPEPLGKGSRAPDGWWSRLVAWAQRRRTRGRVGPADRGGGAEPQ